MKIIIKLKDDSWNFEQNVKVEMASWEAALNEVKRLVYINDDQLLILKKEGFVKIPGITIWRVL